MIGEVVAGLMLGPSFFGWVAPALYARLFPAASLPVLNELSQIGLVLFMFLVGLHLDLTEVYALRRVAGLACLLSIVAPFLLGLLLAPPLHPCAVIADASVFAAHRGLHEHHSISRARANSCRSETERHQTGARRDRMRGLQ